MKDLLLRVRVVVRTSNTNFTSSFGRLRQNIARKSVPHVQHDYFSSFNQSNHLFVALSSLSSNLKLLIVTGTLQRATVCKSLKDFFGLYSAIRVWSPIDSWLFI